LGEGIKKKVPWKTPREVGRLGFKNLDLEKKKRGI